MPEAKKNIKRSQPQYNDYMRNYMRKLKGSKPRKEIYEVKFAEFREIILAGGYDNVGAACKTVGVCGHTGLRWLERIRAQARETNA